MNDRPIWTLLGIAAGLVLATNASSDIINVGPGDSIQAAIGKPRTESPALETAPHRGTLIPDQMPGRTGG